MTEPVDEIMRYSNSYSLDTCEEAAQNSRALRRSSGWICSVQKSVSYHRSMGYPRILTA